MTVHVNTKAVDTDMCTSSSQSCSPVLRHTSDPITCHDCPQVEEVNAVEPGLMQDAERFFVLTQTDNLWKEHLQAIKFLQQVGPVCLFAPHAVFMSAWPAYTITSLYDHPALLLLCCKLHQV